MSLHLSAQIPQRIVSLVPSITKELVLLGLDEKIVGITNYCQIPDKGKYPVVASAMDVNIEKIITLNPELVFASSLNKPGTLAVLRKAGINVVNLVLPRSYEEINAQFIEIGEMCGKKEKALEIVGGQKEKIKHLQNRIPKTQTLRMFFEIGANPLWCVVPGMFMDDFIRLSGGQNIAKDITNGAISRESVLIRDPEIIIVSSMGIVGAEEVKIWKSYQHLSAVKNDMVFVVDADKSCSPTPVDFVEALEEIITFIYKKK